MWFDVAWGLDVFGGAAEASGCSGELGCVVRVAATHSEDEVSGCGEFAEGALTVFGGSTDCVVEDDFGLWPLVSHEVDQGLDAVDGLGRLSDDANLPRGGDFGDFSLGEDDDGPGEVALEALDFDVSSFANDDRLVACVDE